MSITRRGEGPDSPANERQKALVVYHDEMQVVSLSPLYSEETDIYFKCHSGFVGGVAFGSATVVSCKLCTLLASRSKLGNCQRS